MRHTLAAVALVVLVAGGCAPFRDGEAAPTRPLELPSGRVRTILIDDDGTGQHLRARPIDPGTLADIPGYPAISFGHNYVARVSPDGRTIAAIIWRSGSSSGGSIHLIDTVDWIDRELETTITNHTSGIHFDERGAAVYWAQPKESQLTPSVFGLDLASGRVRELARLHQGYHVRDVVVAAGRVAVFLIPANVSGERTSEGPAGAPRIALIDTGTGRVTDVLLPLRGGYYSDPTAPVDEPFRSIEPGLAWDLPRARLYVADAENDRVLVVDLRTGRITGPFVPQPRRSMLDAIWSLFGSVASAKMVSTSRQHAAIAPDGSRLYITGLRSDFAKAQDGKYHETVTPLQLRVIDTADMSELARIEGGTAPLWISPDGATLITGDNRYDRSVEGYAARSDFKLHLLTTVPSHERVMLPLGGVPMFTEFDRRSRTAFVSVQHFSGGSLGHASLLLIDLERRRVVATRPMDRHFAAVIVLAAP